MQWEGATAGAVAALLGRIVFDWLRPMKRNGNGDDWRVHAMDILLDIQDRQKKIYETVVRISEICHMHVRRDD